MAYIAGLLNLPEVSVDTTRIQLQTLSDTEKFGRLLGRLAMPGDVICLNGDLGAGKTALTQAIARGLDVPDNCYVTSPSFALLHEYPGRLPLYHMDFYRLQDVSEVLDLGFDEYFYQQGLTVIEWAGRAIEVLPEERLNINIVPNADLTRTVTVQGSSRYAALLRHISREFNENNA
ncbi:tRNA (adenosine(37)-N6)-threonylcarbamoyltransferase complex ATPase subunit type 1 TsaE [Desulfopila sp. IMCC35006]|nr:tRNA (adenosine(37)-N6)-threonylcarbamoyltransferase complex ATPase subunit type 1 TsaE [Desulfopila sp. IMCC35006]